MSLDFPPIYAISAGSLVRYYEYPCRGKKLLKSQKSLDNLRQANTKGEMSNETRKLLRKRLSVYFESVFEMGAKWRKENNVCHPIITLTLPSKQMHSDNELKRDALMRFVDLMKNKYDVRFYYWVAEKQENENIHFHILIDRFIEWQWIRKAWNQRLELLGYIDEFEKKHGHRNPNSTDIEMIRNLSKSADYVTKYTTKLKQQGGIEGRCHGESDILRLVDKMKTYGFHEMDEKIAEWINREGFRTYPHEHCVAIYGNIRQVLKNECPKHWALYLAHAQSVTALFYG